MRFLIKKIITEMLTFVASEAIKRTKNMRDDEFKETAIGALKSANHLLKKTISIPFDFVHKAMYLVTDTLESVVDVITLQDQLPPKEEVKLIELEKEDSNE